MMLRRGFLAFTALLGGAAGGYGLFHLNKRRNEIEALKLAFGDQITDEPAVMEFLIDFRQIADDPRYLYHRTLSVAYDDNLTDHQKPDPRGELAITMLATSSNILQALSTNSEMVYTGIFHPYEAPCQNNMSAMAEEF